MKKKLFIFIIILVSFISGFCISHFTSQNNKELTETTKKEREFNSLSTVPVSNSSPTGNKIVFKSFFAYDKSLNLNEFSNSNNEELYFKKIISYGEYQKYKELIPELRTLTEDDFVNYYLIITISKNIDSIYMFNKLTETDGSISLEILKNQQLSTSELTPIYSGVAIVLPNITEVPNENITFTIDQNY